MKPAMAPAFYALTSTTRWKDYVNLLHTPYTLWHLSYVVLGAAIAPSVHLDRLVGTLLAFFLAVGIGSHALDELNGRPLGTGIPRRTLAGLAVVSIGTAMAIGIAAGLVVTLWLLPFVAFGGFIAVGYNLGLWRHRFHSDFWFACGGGAFPVLTSYWINALSLSVEAVLMGCGCFALSLAQRTLSTHVRTVRRQAVDIVGVMEMADGRRIKLDSGKLVSAAERALLLMSLTILLLAVSLLALRLPNS